MRIKLLNNRHAMLARAIVYDLSGGCIQEQVNIVYGGHSPQIADQIIPSFVRLVAGLLSTRESLFSKCLHLTAYYTTKMNTHIDTHR